VGRNPRTNDRSLSYLASQRSSADKATYRLVVEDDYARVEPSSDRPSLRLGVGVLAALYTGFSSATELAHARLVQGSARELTRFSDLFAGPAPALADYF